MTADFAVDGVAPGQNLAAHFKAKSPGTWELVLSKPLLTPQKGTITVSVRDNQGNISRLARTFQLGK